MADRRPSRPRILRLEHQFDRLLAEKLAQAYELLVPEQVRPTVRAATRHYESDQERFATIRR